MAKKHPPKKSKSKKAAAKKPQAKKLRLIHASGDPKAIKAAGRRKKVDAPPPAAEEAAPPAAAPAPEQKKAETPQELRRLVEAVKNADETQPVPSAPEEVARLKKLGMREIPIKGTTLMLVGLIDEKGAPATVEQRVEMAKRLNEVGPKLPRYVQHLVNEKKPESSTRAVAEVAACVASGDKVRLEAAQAKAKEEGKKPAKPEKKAKPAKEGAAKKPAGGIGGLISKMLVDKKGTEEILAEVKKQFPSAKTSAASVAWYRSQLRGEGKLPKP